MIKNYILSTLLGLFSISMLFTQSSVTTSSDGVKTTNSSVITQVSNPNSTDNNAEFVKDTLPQTGVEANHSGLYFTIAGILLLVALFTSRSKNSDRYKVSNKHKK